MGTQVKIANSTIPTEAKESTLNVNSLQFNQEVMKDKKGNELGRTLGKRFERLVKPLGTAPSQNHNIREQSKIKTYIGKDVVKLEALVDNATVAKDRTDVRRSGNIFHRVLALNDGQKEMLERSENNEGERWTKSVKDKPLRGIPRSHILSFNRESKMRNRVLYPRLSSQNKGHILLKLPRYGERKVDLESSTTNQHNVQNIQHRKNTRVISPDETTPIDMSRNGKGNIDFDISELQSMGDNNVFDFEKKLGLPREKLFNESQEGIVKGDLLELGDRLERSNMTKDLEATLEAKNCRMQRPVEYIDSLNETKELVLNVVEGTKLGSKGDGEKVMGATPDLIIKDNANNYERYGGIFDLLEEGKTREYVGEKTERKICDLGEIDEMTYYKGNEGKINNEIADLRYETRDKEKAKREINDLYKVEEQEDKMRTYEQNEGKTEIEISELSEERELGDLEEIKEEIEKEIPDETDEKSTETPKQEIEKEIPDLERVDEQDKISTVTPQTGIGYVDEGREIRDYEGNRVGIKEITDFAKVDGARYRKTNGEKPIMEINELNDIGEMRDIEGNKKKNKVTTDVTQHLAERKAMKDIRDLAQESEIRNEERIKNKISDIPEVNTARYYDVNGKNTEEDAKKNNVSGTLLTSTDKWSKSRVDNENMNVKQIQGVIDTEEVNIDMQINETEVEMKNKQEGAPDSENDLLCSRYLKGLLDEESKQINNERVLKKKRRSFFNTASGRGKKIWDNSTRTPDMHCSFAYRIGTERRYISPSSLVNSKIGKRPASANLFEGQLQELKRAWKKKNIELSQRDGVPESQKIVGGPAIEGRNSMKIEASSRGTESKTKSGEVGSNGQVSCSCSEDKRARCENHPPGGFQNRLEEKGGIPIEETKYENLPSEIEANGGTGLENETRCFEQAITRIRMLAEEMEQSRGRTSDSPSTMSAIVPENIEEEENEIKAESQTNNSGTLSKIDVVEDQMATNTIKENTTIPEPNTCLIQDSTGQGQNLNEAVKLNGSRTQITDLNELSLPEITKISESEEQEEGGESVISHGEDLVVTETCGAADQSVLPNLLLDEENGGAEILEAFLKFNETVFYDEEQPIAQGPAPAKEILESEFRRTRRRSRDDASKIIYKQGNIISDLVPYSANSGPRNIVALVRKPLRDLEVPDVPSGIVKSPSRTPVWSLPTTLRKMWREEDDIQVWVGYVNLDEGERQGLGDGPREHSASWSSLGKPKVEVPSGGSRSGQRTPMFLPRNPMRTWDTGFRSRLGTRKRLWWVGYREFTKRTPD